MRNALSLKVLPGLLALLAVGCSGGGSNDATSSVRIRCIDGQAFCLISCDLGCTQTGCAVTEIAENQRLRFSFSDRIEPSSVNSASVSIRTASGVAPDGELLVSGAELTFAPRVRTVNGVSTFGFQRNETYIITLTSGTAAGQGIRSASGDSLSREFTCTVVASRGIVDEDQQPPTVQMIAPSTPNGVPLDPTVVLRFSELIDTTPLRGTLTAASPIRIVLRRALQNGTVCDRDAQGISLEALPRLSTEIVNSIPVTVVTFKPTVTLPGLSCVEIVVTADLRDLSGRQAVPATFQFFTEAGVSTPLTFTETFSNASGLDPIPSGGTWGPGATGNGARPAQIGYDGRHGSFLPSLGTQVSSTEYEWNTDNFVIPASHSLTGLEYTITDGKFYFTDFVLPESISVRFTGTIPPQIWVRGQADVRGNLKVNAASMPFWVPTTGLASGQRVADFNGRGATNAPAPYINGQPGSAPGAGGGRGGNGGNECQGNGPLGAYNGQNGEDVRLLAGHAYVVNAIGTGGRGASLNPPTGIAAPNTPLLGNVYRAYFASGGTGGGFSGPGGTSTVTPITNLQIGAAPAVGSLFNLLPFPGTQGYTSLNHFVVGGSGGGGGGSHAFGTIYLNGDVYIAGGGGTGGGGALALRAGGDLTVAGPSVLEAKGGDGALITGDDRNTPTADTNWGISSPGGGGSGGSFLLQSGADLIVNGTVDTRGGTGSRTGLISLAAANVTSQAGNGSNGFYRLEAVGTVNFGGTGFPAFVQGQNSAALQDSDPFSGCQSTWRNSNLVFPPEWLRYELDVDANGDGTIDTTYTDSGAVGTQKANDINGPVVIVFQGAQLTQSGSEPLPGTVGPWREGIGSGAGPGIGLDSALGFRFMMTFNRLGFPDCVVKGLRVYART